jgi:hypothetical protein
MTAPSWGDDDAAPEGIHTAADIVSAWIASARDTLSRSLMHPCFSGVSLPSAGQLLSRVSAAAVDEAWALRRTIEGSVFHFGSFDEVCERARAWGSLTAGSLGEEGARSTQVHDSRSVSADENGNNRHGVENGHAVDDQGCLEPCSYCWDDAADSQPGSRRTWDVRGQLQGESEAAKVRYVGSTDCPVQHGQAASGALNHSGACEDSQGTRRHTGACASKCCAHACNRTGNSHDQDANGASPLSQVGSQALGLQGHRLGNPDAQAQLPLRRVFRHAEGKLGESCPGHDRRHSEGSSGERSYQCTGELVNGRPGACASAIDGRGDQRVDVGDGVHSMSGVHHIDAAHRDVSWRNGMLNDEDSSTAQCPKPLHQATRGSAAAANVNVCGCQSGSGLALPSSGTDRPAKAPLVFMHGVGFGVFPYLGFVLKLLRAFPGVHHFCVSS